MDHISYWLGFRSLTLSAPPSMNPISPTFSLIFFYFLYEVPLRQSLTIPLVHVEEFSDLYTVVGMSVRSPFSQSVWSSWVVLHLRQVSSNIIDLQLFITLLESLRNIVNGPTPSSIWQYVGGCGTGTRYLYGKDGLTFHLRSFIRYHLVG